MNRRKELSHQTSYNKKLNVIQKMFLDRIALPCHRRGDGTSAKGKVMIFLSALSRKGRGKDREKQWLRNTNAFLYTVQYKATVSDMPDSTCYYHTEHGARWLTASVCQFCTIFAL